MLAPAEADVLLDLADAAIGSAFGRTTPTDPDAEPLPAALHREVGTFVTLTVAGRLNGCVGTVEPTEPLFRSVPRLARSAAFDDPRLPPLQPDDLAALRVEVSVLSPRRPVRAWDRHVLLTDLTPQVHGLVLRSGRRAALFLPSVWEQLPDPDDFVDHLLRKAGLPTGGWPDELVAEVFTTTSHGRRSSLAPPPDDRQRSRDAGW